MYACYIHMSAHINAAWGHLIPNPVDVEETVDTLLFIICSYARSAPVSCIAEFRTASSDSHLDRHIRVSFQPESLLDGLLSGRLAILRTFCGVFGPGPFDAGLTVVAAAFFAIFAFTFF